MASLEPQSSLKDYQDFVREVYGRSNERHFTVDEMLTNISRFAMRGLKGIRLRDSTKIRANLIVAVTWFFSLLNQLDIDLETAVWQRFPYTCSYCGECPCACKQKKIKRRLKVKSGKSMRSKTIQSLQEMIRRIYPPERRTLEDAGVHFAEEIGELSEAVLLFRGHHRDQDFDKVVLEAADLFSCAMGIYNSLGVDFALELARLFGRGCHVCKQTPCICTYDFVMNFKF
ncbi:MAG: hypothetical protein QOG91_179 [Candidatus Parcubacteria bacterium]|jgi:NTP pyrophosphatase (non-canonical NTP hydrolase)|nr:hypothetical protein [Candidatus Parcubacteria bacterium]